MTCLLATVALAAVLFAADAVLVASAAALAVLLVSAIAGRPVLRPLQSALAGMFSPSRMEPAEAPRFAQVCGLVVLAASAAALLAGLQTLALALLALLAGLSFLLAAFDICLGCMLYGVLFRARRAV